MPQTNTLKPALDERLDYPTKLLKDMLLKMHLTRFFEDAAFQQYSLGKVHGTMHLCAGQEAVAVGAIAALRADDAITSTHRGHGHAIAKGQDINTMMAELLAKETGVCRGRGGSMHMADVTLGSLGANGVVSGGIPLSVGAGLSIRLRGTDQVCICFFGDGASNEGAFHESINMAAVWKLPVIYLCENNQYGMSMSLKRANSAADIADRAAGYGIPGETVDGMDPLAVYEAVGRAVEHARSGQGPSLINALTYRYYGHSKSDKQRYRSREEVEAWRAKDPIPAFRDRLAAAGVLAESEAAAIEAQAQKTIEDSIAWGDAGPEPSVEHLTDDVYADEPAVLAAPERVLPAWIKTAFGPQTRINPTPGTRELSSSEALREAMHQALAADERVYLMGEDIGIYGGAFGVTMGLVEEFGEERVRDTPISENAIVGAAVGSAVTGMRPVAEMQFMDFITLGMEQLVLQGAKIRYMFGGKASVPMVLRMPAGSGTGAAAQHSESLESWLVNVPGLKVVAPSTPYDAKGLLLAAIADNNPVMFVENKLLYKVKGPVPEEPYIVPLGKAAIRRQGKDLSVVATSIMVVRALEAAQKLAQEGIEMEVIDLRTLKPYDSDTIIESVKRTGRLLVVHEAPLIGGFGGEIAAMIAQSEAFAYLEAPIVRLGGADVPIPYSPKLERAAVPQTDDIALAARQLARLEI
jgi:pyruvate dehydrogenase E1 component alpha subunit